MSHGAMRYSYFDLGCSVPPERQGASWEWHWSILCVLVRKGLVRNATQGAPFGGDCVVYYDADHDQVCRLVVVLKIT